jgi:hypothetical protein
LFHSTRLEEHYNLIKQFILFSVCWAIYKEGSGDLEKRARQDGGSQGIYRQLRKSTCNEAEVQLNGTSGSMYRIHQRQKVEMGSNQSLMIPEALLLLFLLVLSI